MQNLRDKLLKAGLVSQDQTKTVETEEAKTPRPPPSHAPRRDERPPRRERDERPPPREQPRRDERPPRAEASDAPRPSFPPRGPGGPGGRPQGQGGRPQGGRPYTSGRPYSGSGGRPSSEPVGGPVPKLPPLPGSKAAQRIESKKQVEVDKKLRELVYGGQVSVDVGATVFYFMTRKGKLRRMELTEGQAKQLEEGALGVVERPEPAQIEHSLVPAAVAEQMFAVSKKSVRFLNRKESPIGFMSDDQVKEQQAAEARGDAPVDEGEDEVAEAPAAAPETAAASPETPSTSPQTEESDPSPS